MEGSMGEYQRWMAEITYTDGTPPEVFAFEELLELQDIIERGPNWNAIDRIVVMLNFPSVKPTGEII
jgi:hypothetical protein